jgi:glycosyltransferase involved in cell wall biosynthesis
MNARVGIGLPVRNGERYLEQAIASLLEQTLTDFELVISDNCSTDGTEEICRAAAANDERVRYERSTANRGGAWNFNHVFGLTSSEYFKWAAYDDACEPTFVERCVAALDAVPEAALAYPRTRFIDEESRLVHDHDDHLALEQPSPHDRLRALVTALGYANPIYGLIRSDALRKTRLHGAYPSSDYVLLCELALAGTFIEIPQPLFLRRLHPEMSRSVNPSAAEAAVWFRPQAQPRYRAESWRLFVEHLNGIARAPLPPLERLRCGVAFAEVGGRRYAHHLVRELMELAVASTRSFS